MVIRLLLLIPLVTLFSAVSSETLRGAVPAGNIHPNFRLSFSERIRMLSWDNTITLADSLCGGQSFTRHRTTLSGQWFPSRRFECMLKLTNEFRYYFVPETKKFNWDEIIIDLFYIKWHSRVGMPATLTLGRQNIILGEGFIVMDGHPLDGSRSIYFNAARLDLELSQRNKLTMFYSYQPETDDILPVIHDRKQKLIEQPEKGVGVCYSGNLTQVNLQGYFIRKDVSATATRPTKSVINSVGGRLQLPTAAHLTVTAEGAYQFGKYGDVSRSAVGGYARIDYQTNWQLYLPRLLSLETVCLSGDNPVTVKYEGWEPMFARWPKWSESYIYTQIKEDAVAWWTNLISLHGGARFQLAPSLDLSLDYHHLLAFREPVDSLPFPGGNGKTRGDLFIGKLTFQINDYLSGHLLWEGFLPGNYYFSTADPYSWVRFELLLKL